MMVISAARQHLQPVPAGPEPGPGSALVSQRLRHTELPTACGARRRRRSRSIQTSLIPFYLPCIRHACRGASARSDGFEQGCGRWRRLHRPPRTAPSCPPPGRPARAPGPAPAAPNINWQHCDNGSFPNQSCQSCRNASRCALRDAAAAAAACSCLACSCGVMPFTASELPSIACRAKP